ncbi:acyl-CoA desaturase [Anabaena sp. UHCC 0451]|uniref:acyl-CoA desaturase n=1 Tax=Anabaena sp. UHCC 0451 TaxID=2055235 RepID=UPI002B215B85|nr:acyl-CoA desaturase [Anabaena sp. UHCC 0451]MEA5575649.1 acyl-CoA desaturase [Anabaena sp. UHCC 0451]
MKKYPRLLALSYSLGPFLIIVTHLGAFLPFFTGLSWSSILWAVALYVVRMMSITAIYHRLLIHKSYQAPAIIKWVGSIIACSSGQMGPNWWKGHHIQGHHNNSDQPDDSHSPHTPFKGFKGFLWSQCGWLLSRNFFPPSLPADLEADWVLKTIDRLHFIPLILLGAISFWIGGLEFFGAFCLSTMILFHCVAFVNSLAHIFGKTPFVSNDYSRNNWFVAMLTFGEGWHNMHHAFQWSARHGFSVKEGKIVYLIDPTYQFIRLLERLHLSSNLKLPTEAELLQAANSVSTAKKITVDVFR